MTERIPEIGVIEYEALRKSGMVVEGVVNGVRKIVEFEGSNGNRREIDVVSEVRLMGSGPTRKAETLFVPTNPDVAKELFNK